jgi:hypothetical protein
MPPAQSATLIMHEWPSSGSRNLTNFRRKSSNDGALLCEGVPGVLNGPEPTVNAVGGDLPLVKDSAIGERTRLCCAFGANDDCVEAYGWLLLPVEGRGGSLCVEPVELGDSTLEYEIFLPCPTTAVGRAGLRALDGWSGDGVRPMTALPPDRGSYADRLPAEDGASIGGAGGSGWLT